jgi:hypothetical protein
LTFSGTGINNKMSRYKYQFRVVEKAVTNLFFGTPRFAKTKISTYQENKIDTNKNEVKKLLLNTSKPRLFQEGQTARKEQK